MIEKKYDIGYLGSGPMGFEEVSGVAGEDLAENDVVGYFNKPNNMYAFANYDVNKNYYNDGDNYYISHDSVIDIYDSNDVLLETRNLVGTLIYATQSKSIDWSYVLRSEEFCVDVYRYQNSKYELVVTIDVLSKHPTLDMVSTTLLGVTETLNYIAVYTQTSYDNGGTNYSRLHYCHIINKEDLTINYYRYKAADRTIHTGQAIVSDYYRDYVYFSYSAPISGSWAANIHITWLDLKTTVMSSITNPMNANFDEMASLYVRDNTQFICMYYRPNAGSSLLPASIYVRNANGTGFNVDYSAPSSYSSKKPTYLVSASSDFNEVIYHHKGTTYLMNVENQTNTALSGEDIPNYYIKLENLNHASIYDKNTMYPIYVLNDSVPDKVGRVTDFNSSFNKIDHCGQGLFDYVGIVKEGCKQGENVTVYKIIDF